VIKSIGMAEKVWDLKLRTKLFAVAVIKYVEAMPNGNIKFTVGKQLIRSGTSVGANYRAACRGRSDAEWIAKLGICEEESDECMFWLEIILETTDYAKVETQKLHTEAEELLKIIVTSINTSRGGPRKS
ncbi:MAG TPA: four helix bundle protein, partial [Chitinophagales bacterium]|nr:four helix bundle protein [Chitinophagales bacterium]